MTSLIVAAKLADVVLDQRQLRSGVSLMSSVLEVWVGSKRKKCNRTKNESRYHPLRSVVALHFGDVFRPNRAGND